MTSSLKKTGKIGMRRLLLTLIPVLIHISLYSQSGARIVWEPVPGAWGYALEIKDSSGAIIIDKEIKESFYSVAQFQAGEYSFRIATLNMLKQRGEKTGWARFTVQERYIPQLNAVSKKQFISTYVNRNIIITGKNFRPESVFVLRGNGREIKLSDVEIVSENEVHIKYRPSLALRGKYDLVVVNKWDTESVLKDAVEIITPEEAERYYYIGGGYMASKPVGVWADYMAASFTGGMLYFQFSLKNPFFENILLETEVDAVRFSNIETINTSSLTSVSLGLGAGYYYPFYSLNLELFVKLNGGPVYSVLTLDENVVDRETTSLDWFVMGGAGLRIFLGESFFIEPALSWKTAFYKAEFLHTASAALNVGYKF